MIFHGVSIRGLSELHTLSSVSSAVHMIYIIRIIPGMITDPATEERRRFVVLMMSENQQYIFLLSSFMFADHTNVRTSNAPGVSVMIGVRGQSWLLPLPCWWPCPASSSRRLGSRPREESLCDRNCSTVRYSSLNQDRRTGTLLIRLNLDIHKFWNVILPYSKNFIGGIPFCEVLILRQILKYKTNWCQEFELTVLTLL